MLLLQALSRIPEVEYDLKMLADMHARCQQSQSVERSGLAEPGTSVAGDAALANDIAERCTGWSEDVKVGHHWWFLVSPEYACLCQLAWLPLRELLGTLLCGDILHGFTTALVKVPVLVIVPLMYSIWRNMAPAKSEANFS